MSDSDSVKLSDLAREFDDISIPCIDCFEEFIWTAGEQDFYQQKNLLNPPKRCKNCKQAKNRRLFAITESRSTGKPPRIEVTAECARCNSSTTIPFYPSQGRPVYCRKCFVEIQTEIANSANV